MYTVFCAIAEEIIILRSYDRSILDNHTDCKQSLTLSIHQSWISSLLRRQFVDLNGYMSSVTLQ